MKKRIIQGMVAASVSAAIIGGCIFMTNAKGHSVDVSAASIPSVTAESKTEIPSEYPSEAVYLHNRADIQKQKAGQEAWKKAQAEKKAADEKKKADDELAAKEKAANDAMQAVWDFPNGCLKDGATRDMLADAQAKIEALPDGNATKDALYPAIAAADNAFTVIENQQKAAQEQQEQQQQQTVSDAQVQQIANEISYTSATVDASSFNPESFNDSAVNCIDSRLQQVAWNIISAVKNNQSGIVYVGTIEHDALYQDYEYMIDQAVMGYFGIDNTGYVYCDENGENAFCMELPDGSEPQYIIGADAGYNLWQAAKQKSVASQQMMGQVPVDEAERVRAINDKVCQLLTYDYSYSIYDADTALATGTGVCEAYAQLFHRIASACGLQDRICVGPTNNGYHAWNQTMVNGQWLYTDSTWNDCLGSDTYLLSSGLWSDHLGIDYYE